MYQDKQNTYSQDQTVTASAASAHVYDAGAGGRDIGHGRDLDLVVLCTETVASGGASTVQFHLEDSADNSAFAKVVGTPAIGKASLVAGTEVLRVALPSGLRRYTRLYYTVTTADLTAGKFTAFLALERQANHAYPRGYTMA
jgi:hypothetical protein